MSYAAEIYRSGGRGDGSAPNDRDIEGVVASLREEGADVIYLGSVLIPGDDMAFYLFEAPSPDHVEQALRRLNLAAERIVDARATGFVSEERAG